MKRGTLTPEDNLWPTLVRETHSIARGVFDWKRGRRGFALAHSALDTGDLPSPRERALPEVRPDLIDLAAVVNLLNQSLLGLRRLSGRHHFESAGSRLDGLSRAFGWSVSRSLAWCIAA